MHIFKSGLQNDFELLRILNYWSLNYRSSTVFQATCADFFIRDVKILVTVIALTIWTPKILTIVLMKTFEQAH